MKIERNHIIFICVGVLMLCLVLGLILSQIQKDRIGPNESQLTVLASNPAPKEQYDVDNRPAEKNKKANNTLSGNQQPQPFQPAAPSPAYSNRSRYADPYGNASEDEDMRRIQEEIRRNNVLAEQRTRQQQQRKEEEVRQIVDLIQKNESSTDKKKDTQQEEKEMEYEQKEIQNHKLSPRFSRVEINPKGQTNAIHAYVHSEQIVQVGSTLKMRVAEDCLTDDGKPVRKNAFVYGKVRSIGDQRVMVSITHINVDGNILPFKKDVYSRDAQLGLYVPTNGKTETLQDASAGAVEGSSTNLNVPTANLGIAAGVSAVNGLTSGLKNAKTKNIRRTKVIIKTNYEVLFMEHKTNAADNL